jgi:hypothetical protein
MSLFGDGAEILDRILLETYADPPYLVLDVGGPTEARVSLGAGLLCVR